MKIHARVVMHLALCTDLIITVPGKNIIVINYYLTKSGKIKAKH
jgi:hypothetical protein